MTQSPTPSTPPKPTSEKNKSSASGTQTPEEKARTKDLGANYKTKPQSNTIELPNANGAVKK